MKRILTATAIAAALTAGNAQAGSDNKPFNVNITLTSACTLTAVTDLAFTYTSLQTGASTATGGGFNVSCTNSLPYTFKLVQSGGAGGQQVSHTGIVVATELNGAVVPACSASVYGSEVVQFTVKVPPLEVDAPACSDVYANTTSVGDVTVHAEVRLMVTLKPLVAWPAACALPAVRAAAIAVAERIRFIAPSL